MQRLAKRAGHRHGGADLRAAGGGNLPKFGGRHRRRRDAARRLPQDAHSRRSAVQRGNAAAPGDAGGPDPASQHGGFRVWKTRYATIGVLICWDQWYPEAARITSLLGAEVLFYPTAIGWHPRSAPNGDKHRSMPGARFNDPTRSPTACSSPPQSNRPRRRTRHQWLTFFGHSFIVDPFGRYVADAGEDEEVLVAQCDPALIEIVRRNWPFLRDRRVDVRSVTSIGISARDQPVV